MIRQHARRHRDVAAVVGADRGRAAGPEDRRRSSPSTRARGRPCPRRKCKQYDCDDNTARYAREQVGSSFKPYVLSTAVSQGMNVKTSTLNTSPYVCVAAGLAADATPRRSRPGCTASRARQRLQRPGRVQGRERRRRDHRQTRPKGAAVGDQRAERARPVLQHRRSPTSRTGSPRRTSPDGGQFGVNLADYPTARA